MTAEVQIDWDASVLSSESSDTEEDTEVCRHVLPNGLLSHARGRCPSPLETSETFTTPIKDALEHPRLDELIEEDRAHKRKYATCFLHKGFATAYLLKKIQENYGDVTFIECYKMRNGVECYTFAGLCPIHNYHHSSNHFQYKRDPQKGYAGWKCWHDDSYQKAVFIE